MHKVDGIQGDIVKALRAVGATVQDLSAVGEGCPDLLVGIYGKNILLEVKEPKTGRLTPKQAMWHCNWKGKFVIVRSVEDALRAVGCIV